MERTLLCKEELGNLLPHQPARLSDVLISSPSNSYKLICDGRATLLTKLQLSDTTRAVSWGRQICSQYNPHLLSEFSEFPFVIKFLLPNVKSKKPLVGRESGQQFLNGHPLGNI